jgi:hypothetical protein
LAEITSGAPENVRIDTRRIEEFLGFQGEAYTAGKTRTLLFYVTY